MFQFVSAGHLVTRREADSENSSREQCIQGIHMFADMIPAENDYKNIINWVNKVYTYF